MRYFDPNDALWHCIWNVLRICWESSEMNYAGFPPKGAIRYLRSYKLKLYHYKMVLEHRKLVVRTRIYYFTKAKSEEKHASKRNLQLKMVISYFEVWLMCTGTKIPWSKSHKPKDHYCTLQLPMVPASYAQRAQLPPVLSAAQSWCMQLAPLYGFGVTGYWRSGVSAVGNCCRDQKMFGICIWSIEAESQALQKFLI